MKETAEVPLRILVFRPTSRIPFAGNSLFEKETLLTLMPSQPQVFPWIGQDRLRPEPTPSRRQDWRIRRALFCVAQLWYVREQLVSATR